MLEFKEITIKNFLSFGNIPQTITLNDTKYQVVVGFNRDKSSNPDEKNGVGKSSITNAIHFALFGKAIGNKINLPTLVNNINRKNMVVKLSFSKNNIDYVIERGRQPTFLRFIRNNEEITVDESLGDSRNTQDIIEEVLGLDDILFNQLVLITCQTPIFLEQPISIQKNIIERVLGVNIISEKIIKLKDLLKDTKNEINNETFKYNTLLEQQKKTIDNVNQQLKLIDKNEAEWLDKIEKELLDSKIKLESLIQIDIKAEETAFDIIAKNDEIIKRNKLKEVEVLEIDASIKELNAEETTLNTTLQELSKIDIKAEIEKHNEISILKEKEQLFNTKKHQFLLNKSQYDSSMKLFSKLGEDIKSLSVKIEEINNNNTCPTCKQPITSNDLEIIKQELENKLLENAKQYNITDASIKELENKIAMFKEETFKYPTVYYKTLNEAYSHQNSLNTLKTKLDNIFEKKAKLTNKLRSIQIEDIIPTPKTHYSSKEELLNHKITIKTLKARIEELEHIENPYEFQRENVKTLLTNVETPDDKIISSLNNDLLHQSFLLKLLNSPSSHIRKAVLDKSLAFLNQRLKVHLSQLGSTHLAQFNNDMSLLITQHGLEFGYVSSGEVGRINLAIIFSFRDVWEALNNCSINLLFIDEVCERSNLDVSGIQFLIDWITKGIKANNIFIVSHNENILASAPKQLNVIKENGFTKIEV